MDRNFIGMLMAAFSGLLILAFGLGQAGCPPKPTPEPEPGHPTPEEVVADLQSSADYVVTGIALVEQIITSYSVPQFFACVAADEGRARVLQFQAAAPDLVAFVEAGGGELAVAPYPVAFDRCSSMEGKPDPWPMVEVPAEWQTVIEWAVQLVTGMLVDLIKAKAPPPEAPGYHAFQVGLAILTASPGEFQHVWDFLTGAPTTEVPGFTLAWTPDDGDDGDDSTPTILLPDGTERRIAPIMASEPCAADSARTRAQCELEAAANGVDWTP